jgi:hypothetical protein
LSPLSVVFSLCRRSFSTSSPSSSRPF